MKITQEPKFQPITITIETEEEAIAFSNIVACRIGITSNDAAKKLIDSLYQWFYDRLPKDK